MSVKIGSGIVSDSLVFHVDAANLNSYNPTTNLLTYSEEFDNAVWIKSADLTVLSNQAIAPDGTNTADKVYVSSNGGATGVTRHTTTTQVAHTQSIYFKSAGWNYVFIWLDNGSGLGYTVELNLSNGNARLTRSNAGSNFNTFSYSVDFIGNGWYRVNMTATLAGSNTNLNTRFYPSNVAFTSGSYGTEYPASDGTNGIYVWGAQLEKSSSASKYVKTTTNTQSLTLYDLTTNANNGSFVNTPTYDYGNKGSLVFNGSNYINIGSTQLPLGSSPGTICAWASSDVVNTAGWIISYGNPSTSQSRYVGLLGSYYYFGAYASDVFIIGALANTWFNIVGVYDGTYASLYINGNLLSGPSLKSWNTVSNTAQIGRQTTGGEYFVGKIGQVSIYNRALSASEVKQNFDATRSRYGV